MSNKFISINPANLKRIATYTVDKQSTIEQKLTRSHRAFTAWRTSKVKDRVQLLLRLEKAILSRKEDLATMATLEMGKPISQSIKEVEKCAFVCRYYADRLPGFLADITIESSATHSYVSFQPLGSILAVMPWNFPYWQVFRSLVPIIAGGNAYVLKHANNVTGCALLVQEVMQAAKAPEGLCELLLVPVEKLPGIIAHQHIAAVTCTGSTRAGRAIATAAGAVIKKCVLELGGSDASVFLSDAPIKESVASAAFSRLINNGQSCIAAKRFVVTKSQHNKIVEALAAEFSAIKIGDPMDMATDLGPLARLDLAETLHAQVKASARKGARILECNFTPDFPTYFAPTILTNVQEGMVAYQEELFGPVASIITAQNNKHAIQIANDSNYGLGAAIYSKDGAKAEHLAKYELDAGNCFVNDFVRSVPGMPFGGIKQSGYGRELGSWGMHEFMNVKTVYVTKG
ncbi:MAG: hypothetical protein RL660_307 [Bacteroidota bacterium]|jgi:succinate-semialdehyde dehydrogenase/glutarate-semialdehyde dehydrogenase